MERNLYCKYCGKQFVAKSYNGRFCSIRCKNISYRLNHGINVNPNIVPYKKKCVICDNYFETFEDRRKCCSKECSDIYEFYRKRKINKVQCTICGKEFITGRSDRKTCGNTECQKKLKAIRNKSYQKADKEIRKIRYIENLEVRKCIICGKNFSCHKKESTKTCSTECHLIYKKAKRNTRSDRRLNPDNIVDHDITLKKLFSRDKGICQICGEICDWEDFKIINGNFIAGNNYPSIDHIIPLSRNGNHSWENVQLSHFKCNWGKGNSTLEFPKERAIEEMRIMASERAIKKKTAQYGLNGELIKIWDSTAQIKRDLGFSDKHIQNVCRHTKSKTGNAYGYHWEYIS